MVSLSSFPLSLVNLLYYGCFLLLLGMAGFVLAKKPRAWLHRVFALTALSLLAWQASLFLFNHASGPSTALWLGRINFAAMVFVVFFAWLLVRAIAGIPLPKNIGLLSVETLFLGLLTAFTSLVDRAELPSLSYSMGTASGITSGAVAHITHYGVLFPLYLLHVTCYLIAALATAFTVLHAYKSGARREDTIVHEQLLLVGAGMLATGLVALVTNVVLPYGWGDFTYTDVGTLSTILFLLAVAYAIVKHHLFDIRVLLRKTLVYGLLLSLVLAAYSAIALLVTDHLAQASASGVSRFGVLILAFSFDPIRRFLEKRIDHLLFREARARKHISQKHLHTRVSKL